ncbi:MAG: outer membrane protein assembly factor BamE [Verrucomicrobia bacterium]|nr:outer membrane protein assembly factor BamE [Verrucomicrobiota bacterium]
MSGKVKVVTVFAILLLGVFGFLVFFFNGHTVPLDRFEQVKVGMTKDQVQEIMGVPRYIRHNSAEEILGVSPASRYDTTDYTAFCYGSFGQLKYCTMEIYFGLNSRVSGKFHDH